MTSSPKSYRSKLEELIVCPNFENCPAKCEYCSCYIEPNQRTFKKQDIYGKKLTSQSRNNISDNRSMKKDLRKCHSYCCRDDSNERQV